MQFPLRVMEVSIIGLPRSYTKSMWMVLQRVYVLWLTLFSELTAHLVRSFLDIILRSCKSSLLCRHLTFLKNKSSIPGRFPFKMSAINTPL
ncbi:hypothetical protein PsorP6_015792 [Peronosclerospora sorghi]|uniref:Uncharacterized protein n=1 Tax=Peronosclerospora sorghi TaxID=230839 RepID=A0ACC0WPY6_9STRA|nr:hypothetical protein PsorP6_015792 [Peronosclerospora sorghi]